MSSHFKSYSHADWWIAHFNWGFMEQRERNVVRMLAAVCGPRALRDGTKNGCEGD